MFDEDVCDDFGSDVYCCGMCVVLWEMKMLTRTLSSVSKAFRLILFLFVKLVKWDVVFDELKLLGCVLIWFFGCNVWLMVLMLLSEMLSSSKFIAVSWFGERDDDGDDVVSL